MKTRPKQSKPPARQRLAATAPSVTAPRRRATAARSPVPAPKAPGSQWTFLTNHSHVLIILARNPSVVLREVALQVGITERAVQRIVADLEAVGAIKREKIGRRNQYQIQGNQKLRHTVASHRTIGELLAFIDHPDA